MVLFKKVTRHSPRVWGPSIVGYGSYRYTYESGRTGEAPLAGFAMPKGTIVTVLAREGDESFVLDAAAEAELLESRAEGDRGDVVSEEDVLRALRNRA